MKLEQQVVSLELARKFKELGVKQESVCYWRQFQLDSEFDNQIIWDVDTEMSYRSTISNVLQSIAAYTVAELGEMLPAKLELTTPPMPFPKTEQTTLMFGRYGSDGYWEVTYVGVESENIYAEQKAATEADARAKMLIYLLENNLITRDTL